MKAAGPACLALSGLGLGRRRGSGALPRAHLSRPLPGKVSASAPLTMWPSSNRRHLGAALDLAVAAGRLRLDNRIAYVMAAKTALRCKSEAAPWKPERTDRDSIETG